MVGPKRQDFWPRINILNRKLKKKKSLTNYGLSKSAKIILSMSMFNVGAFIYDVRFLGR